MLISDLDLSQSLLRGLEIRAHQKVIYDVTILYGGSGVFSPRFGFLEQDIVVGKPLKVPDYFGQYFYRSGNKTEVFEPEIIMEIKYGHVNTHQLMTYSYIASEIKAVFPRCRYYLVLGYCSGSVFEKTMRHGRHFDRVFNLCFRSKKEVRIPDYTKGKLNVDAANNKTYSNLIQHLTNDLSSTKLG